MELTIIYLTTTMILASLFVAVIVALLFMTLGFAFSLAFRWLTT